MSTGDWAGLKADSQAAWKEAIEWYTPMLYGIARSILRDHHLAEEAVQDAWVVARQRIGQVRYEGHLEGWLIKITRNQAINQLRRSRHEKTTADGSIPERKGSGDEPLDELIREEFWQLVELPEKDRQIIIAFYRDGFTAAEIADQMGLSKSTVQNRKSRAIADLCASMEA